MKLFFTFTTSLFFLLVCDLCTANDTLIYFAKPGIAPGSVWKYLDNNISLDGIAWKDSIYNDAAWATGNSEFGYGDGDENTIVNDGCLPPGSNCNTKNTTTYFRKTFYIANPAAYTSFTLEYKRDDGIEIFINGVRLESNNLTDPVFHNSLAANAVDDGEMIFTVSIPATAFYGTGKKNTIAVAIHQSVPASSDISFDLQLMANTNAVLFRGPYLQLGKQDSISIRWRTDIPTDSKVSWGTVFGTYTNSFSDATLTSEHEMRIGGLAADTKYFYTIGGTAFTLQADASNYFLTLPAETATRKLRFIALGDCGNASANQINVKNTYLNFIGTNNTDAMILLGDNAYSFGLDAEYQSEFFDIYKNDLLKNIKLYPAPGNHDYGNTQANAANRNLDYYKNFSMPVNGEIGGVPSRTEAYYSFNIGNVHFIALDSYGKEDANNTRLFDTSGAQVTWLKNDLEANTKTFTIVYFHHPPYTKTSHNSDTEGELMLIRENFIRILERYGVDLVLCGHSHGYERSYLLKVFYNNNTNPVTDTDFNPAAYSATGTLQNALYNTTPLSCAYTYNSGKNNHGTVYVVSGSAGQLGGTSAGYPHDAMFYSNETNGGLFYFETDSNRLDAKFISYNTAPVPAIKDQFTIFKDVNKVKNINAALNAVVTLTASWRGTYYWPHNAATSQSVVVPTNSLGIYNYIVKDAATNACFKDSFHVTVNTALPLQLISFTATYRNNKVLVNWTTNTDRYTTAFIIEKSTDGIHYSYFTTIPALQTNQNADYAVTDPAPYDGMTYYRLTMINNNGNSTVLGIRKLKKEPEKGFSFRVIQEGKGNVQIAIHDDIYGLYAVTLYDMTGKKLETGTQNAVFRLTLHAGNYFIRIISPNNKVLSGKFTVL
jgi:hypothetical protein